MSQIVVTGCIIVALVCAAIMLRPVRKSERAWLASMADGFPKAEELADNLLAKRWVTRAEFSVTLSAIEFIKKKAHEDAVLAKSMARKAIRDAQSEKNLPTRSESEKNNQAGT